MAIVVDRLPGGPPYRANAYLVRARPEAERALAVDPGDDPAPLLQTLAEAQATLAAILVTHGDVDHVGGVARLARATGAEVFAPAASAPDLRAGRSRGGFAVEPHAVEHELRGGERLALAGLDVDVVETPGHAADHLAFAIEDGLFSGDLLFAGSVGRTDLGGGDYATLLASVSALLTRFPGATRVYPGHGEPTTLARELATNPFLDPLRAA